MKHFKAIAAMSENRVIGRGTGIPWHLPEDFRWFKQMTMGQVIVMGRKTFQSIGRVLPGRATIVLSRSNFHHPGVTVLGDMSAIGLQQETREVFICGGAEIYSQALPFCSDLYLTRVRGVVDGDAFFPPFEEDFVEEMVIRETPEFAIVHYKNRAVRSMSGERDAREG